MGGRLGERTRSPTGHTQGEDRGKEAKGRARASSRETCSEARVDSVGSVEDRGLCGLMSGPHFSELPRCTPLLCGVVW